MTFALSATLRAALANLSIAPLRTALALVGIAIGCAAVVAVLQIGLIAEKKILESLKEAGLDLITVRQSYDEVDWQESSSASAGPTFLDRTDQLEADLRALPGVRQAALVKTHSSSVDIGAGEPAFIQLLEVSRAFVDIAGFDLARGSLDVLAMTGLPIGMVGAGIEGQMGLELGDRLRFGFDGYHIGGVLDHTPYNPMIGYELDQSMIVPRGSLKRLTAETDGWSIVLEALSDAPKEALGERVETFFRDDHDIAVDVVHAGTMIEVERAQQRSLTLLLAALGSISLIVGSVGVANVMLASVSERRGEIGLRMAIGASPFDIRLLFLIEAVLLCLLGGLIGTGIGLIGANLYASLSLAELTISYPVLALALGLSTLAGLVSGYYPASKSSKMDPVRALQSE